MSSLMKCFERFCENWHISVSGENVSCKQILFEIFSHSALKKYSNWHSLLLVYIYLGVLCLMSHLFKTFIPELIGIRHLWSRLLLLSLCPCPGNCDVLIASRTYIPTTVGVGLLLKMKNVRFISFVPKGNFLF